MMKFSEWIFKIDISQHGIVFPFVLALPNWVAYLIAVIFLVTGFLFTSWGFILFIFTARLMR